MKFSAWPDRAGRFVTKDAKQSSRIAKERFDIRATSPARGLGEINYTSALPPPPNLWFCRDSALKPTPQRTPTLTKHRGLAP
jgi:hypothetical protein